ncbi:MAG: carboxylate-amine ligase [Candidatus Dormiibacterota bacterium]
MSDRWLTIGVEEEYQIVNAQGELRSHIDTLLEAAQPTLGEDIKAELLQSVVEVATKICVDTTEARAEIVRLRAAVSGFLAPAGLRIVSAGTHPFASWQDQLVTDLERYKMLEEEMQDVIRELLIFGMHIHVGIPDPEVRIEVANEARYFLPHLLALSTSSPFWMGRTTGLKSYRSVVWSRFPRTGIPPDFACYDDFENFTQLLLRTGCIDTGKKVWWDLRPHYTYPTLEFRVCDAATRVDEAICLAGLAQAICCKLIKLRRSNLGFRKYQPNLIAENKWRAIRFGIDGQLIDFGKGIEVPMRELVVELLEFVDPVLDELGSRRDVEYVNTMIAEGTSADRQLAAYRISGSLPAVVELLAAETMAGVIPVRSPAAVLEATPTE